MNRIHKTETVDNLRETFTQYSSLVVMHNLGVSAAIMARFRRQMKRKNNICYIAKNTLAKIALEGQDFAALTPFMSGPVVIAVSNDPVDLAKMIVTLAKEEKKMVVVAGAIGQNLLTDKDIIALASMPSLNELRGKIIGLVNAPASKLVRTINEPAAQLARLANAYSSK